MKKIFTLFAIFACLPILLSAKGPAVIGGSTYTADTLSHYKVGPGTYYTAIHFYGPKDMRAFYLEIDATNPYLSFQSVLGRDSLVTCEGITNMAARKSKEGSRYFAGTNADFFATSGAIGTPVHGCAVEGQLAKVPVSSGPQTSFTTNDECFISFVTYAGELTHNETTYTIHNVNGSRSTDQLVLYNRYVGNYTHTNAYGYEIPVSLADGEKWGLNKTVKLKVAGTGSAAGNMAIAENGAVLSGHGTSADFLQTLQPGDELEIKIMLQLEDGSYPDINCMVGGDRKILEITRYPADVLVSMEDPNHMVDMDTFLTDELKSVPGGSYTSYEFLTGYDSTEETEDHSSAIFMKDGTAQVDSITRNVLFFSAETYNRITGENVTVEPGTALYMSVDGVPMPDTMTFAGTTYTLLPTPKSFNLRGRYHAYVSKPYVVVLPDYAEKSQVITPTEYYCISLGKLRDEEQQTFYDAIREDVTTIMPDEESVFWDEDGYFNFECRVENTKEIRSMYGSFLFMGISLGFVFTMAAVLIIYYKQISEGMEDKNRFAIMQQVGLSQKEVKHSIHTQILTVFFLPLITAGIHVMFAYPIIRAILRAMMLSSETVFITCTVASFLVFSVLYAVVYALTAKVYYRIISEDSK